MHARLPRENRSAGIFWGGCGIVSFSLTLPMTQLALQDFSPLFITFGRAAGAGIAAILLLALVRAPLPAKSDLRSIILVAAGVVIGFPLFSSLAMMTIPASHGGVVAGIIPILTALAAVVLGERPSMSFWIAAALGLVSVAAFSFLQSSDGVSAGHLLLVAAAAAAAIGYSAGAALASRMPPSHVICWGLGLTLPLSLPVTFLLAPATVSGISAASCGAMAYLTFISMFLGFFAWYRGLAEGGIARVGQVQLAQPLLTVGWAWLLLDETVEPETIAAGCVVVFSIWLTLRSRVTAIAAPLRKTS